MQQAWALRRSHLLRLAASCVQVNGGEWDPKLLFSVPNDHPEVLRLEGRYKRSAVLALPQPLQAACLLAYVVGRAGMASPPDGCAASRLGPEACLSARPIAVHSAMSHASGVLYSVLACLQSRRP